MLSKLPSASYLDEPTADVWTNCFITFSTQWKIFFSRGICLLMSWVCTIGIWSTLAQLIWLHKFTNYVIKIMNRLSVLLSDWLLMIPRNLCKGYSKFFGDLLIFRDKKGNIAVLECFEKVINNRWDSSKQLSWFYRIGQPSKICISSNMRLISSVGSSNQLVPVRHGFESHQRLKVFRLYSSIA